MQGKSYADGGGSKVVQSIMEHGKMVTLNLFDNGLGEKTATALAKSLKGQKVPSSRDQFWK